jgi:hypothetical protein
MPKSERPALINSPAWGERGCPLAPRAFRLGWATSRVPALLEEALGFGPICWTDLGVDIWARTTADPALIKNAVIEAVALTFRTDARRAVADRPVIGMPSPAVLDVRAVPLRVRTSNAICTEESRRGSDLSLSLTVDQFMRLRNVGIASILDYGCTMESALNAISADGATTAPASDIQELWTKYQNQPWANRIYSRDPRFTRILKGTLDYPLRHLPGPPSGRRVAMIEDALKQARPLAKAIARLDLNAQLIGYMKALGGTHHLSGLIARFGFAGEPPCTLREAAEKVGVTRERIRQIESKFLRLQAKAQPRPFMPALEKALERLEHWAPLAASVATERLSTESIAANSFSIESVLSAAKFLGFKPTIELIGESGASAVVKANSGSPSKEALRLVLLKVRSHAGRGIANTTDVQVELSEQGHEVSLDVIKSMLAAVPEIRVLDDWFWDVVSGDNGRHKIVNLTYKILSVNSPLSLQSLREGMRRYARFRGRSAPPPLAVLEAFYRSRPDFKIDEQRRVRAVTKLPATYYLTDVESQMIRILRTAPNALMDRNTFVEACHAARINLATVSSATSYDPCLERVAPNVWAPRGTGVSPIVLEEFRREHGWRNTPSNDVETGWSRDGWPWWTFRVTGVLLAARGAATAPSSIRSILGRDYDCFTDSGQHCGVVHANGGSPFVWGWAGFFGVAGVDVGDYVRASFDIANRKAFLEVGGSELLEGQVHVDPDHKAPGSVAPNAATTGFH